MKKQDTTPTAESITTTPFPNAKKIYVPGQLHNIQVAMREISLTPTKLHNGKGQEENAPVTIAYTTPAGPYTDPNVKIDVRSGLPRLREQWILDRNDVEQLTDISSEYGRKRSNDNALDSFRFLSISKNLCGQKLATT